MVGVGDDLVPAAHQRCDAPVQVLEAECVVARVAPGRLQPQARAAHHGDLEQGQPGEPDQRHLLGHLLQRGTAGGEYRDPVAAVDAVVAQRVGAKYVRFEVVTAYLSGRREALTRDTLAAQLRRDGYPMRNARVSRLLTALKHEAEEQDASGRR